MIFEASRPIRIINTQREFFWMFAHEGENMEEHIRKLHGLQQMLHAMGELWIRTSQTCYWHHYQNHGRCSLWQSMPAYQYWHQMPWSCRLWRSLNPDRLAQGAWRLKDLKRRRSLIIDMPVPPRATAGIVAKRATGLRTVGNQGETKKVKPPSGGNPRTMPNKPKTNQTIMISHSPA